MATDTLRRAPYTARFRVLAAGALFGACDSPPDLHFAVTATLPERADYRVTRVVAGFRVQVPQIVSYTGRGLRSDEPEAAFRVTPAGPLPIFEEAVFDVQRRTPVRTASHPTRWLGSPAHRTFEWMRRMLVRDARQRILRPIVFLPRPYRRGSHGPRSARSCSTSD